MAERLVLTEKQAGVAKSLENKGSDSVMDQLRNVMAKMLQGFEVKWLGQKIDELKVKEEAGTLVDDDRELLSKLTNIFLAKKSEVSSEVDEVFEMIKSGSVRTAKTKAASLVRKYSSDDVEYLADPTKVGEVLKVADAVVDAGSSIANTRLVGGTETAGIAGALVSAEKKQREILGKKVEKSVMEEIDNVVVRVGRLKTKKTFKQALKAAKESGDQKKVELKDSVTPGQNRNQLYNDVLGGRKEIKSRQMSKLLIEEGDKEILEIIRKQNLTQDQADLLLDTAHDLENVENKLDGGRLERMCSRLNPRLKVSRSTSVTVAGVEVLRFSGSRRKRLERVIPLLSIDQDDGENIRIIIQTISPGAGVVAGSREYIEAANVWQEYKGWQIKFGKFQEGVGQLKSQVENRYQTQLGEDMDESDLLGGKAVVQKAMWTTMKEYTVGHKKDGSPIYSPDGERVAELLSELPMKVDDEGRLVPETFQEFIGRMNKEGRGPRMPGVARQRMEQLRPTMNPEEFRKILRDKVVEDIKGIMSTGDSSRAPNNQSISWELNDYLSLLDRAEDGDFRDLWMARLSAYDANIFMGTVETYDDFAKVAGFLPREYLAILWDDKIEELGTFTDVLGNQVHFKLDFQSLRTTLSDKAPGKDDRREIWLQQILDTDNLGEKYQGLRQLMAFKLGEQIGVRLEYMPDGTFVINPNDRDRAQFVTAEGQKVSLLQLVGLDDLGKVIPPDSAEYKRIEEYDLYKEWGFFINQPLIDMDLNLDSVELERGGGKKGKWRHLSNGLRKIHGAAMNDYLKWKQMGMPIARDDGDSYWRSFLAWKLLDKNEQGTMTFLEPLRQELITRGIVGDTQKKFFELLERVVYMPERWKIQSVGSSKSGGLKAIADIRNITDDEYNGLREYLNAFNLSGGADFDWSHILRLMGADWGGGPMVGEAGFKMGLKKFDLNKMITRQRLSHNLWFDFIKYSGYSSEYWKVLTTHVVHPGDPKIHAKLADTIEGYMGDLKEVKAKELLVRHGRYAQSNLEGYETFVQLDDKGKIKAEGTEVWKATSDQEKNEARSMGYKIESDGTVVDENGRRVYRRGRFGFFKDVFNPFARKGWGSPYVRRGFSAESWKRRRELLYGYLRSGLLSPDAWKVENSRYQTELFLGIEIDSDKPVNFAEVKNQLRKKPWKILLIPYTIMRGILVNSPIDFGDLMAGWGPIGKELGRIFSD
jgi:hypothetical protein